MKKSIAVLIGLLTLSLSLFAEKRAACTVESVSGKVTYEVSNGEWADVKAGMKLDMDASVITALNSTLTLNANGTNVTIKPMKKGKISDFLNVGSASKGVMVGSKVTKDDFTAKTSGTAKTVTARASEAKADIEWEE